MHILQGGMKHVSLFYHDFFQYWWSSWFVKGDGGGAPAALWVPWHWQLKDPDSIRNEKRYHTLIIFHINNCPKALELMCFGLTVFFWKKCILPRPFLNPRIPACFVCFNGGTACLCSSFRSWWVRSILPSFSTFAVKTVALWLISTGLYCDSWWWWGRGCCWWWWWWWRRQQHCNTDAGGDNYW